ncbi:MAG: hypothetical protein HON19_07450 [Flavobacteriales bacterium]|jgi:hypothetical protein|nr:hypothetical protein [Flavobacteriales bacterium]
MDAQRLLFCALCFFIGVQSHCQLKIGGDPYRIHPYALLELESSERALLLPRLSTTERDRSFTAPIPVGMLLFNTDTQQLEVWTQNNEWAVLSYVSNETPEVIWEADLLQVGSAAAVDLSNLRSSPQQLILSGDQLILENGGTVDLSPYRHSSDPQLQLEGNILRLDNGGSNVDLSIFKDAPQQLRLEGTLLSLDQGGSVDLNGLSQSTPSHKLNWRFTDSQNASLTTENGNSLQLQASGTLLFSSPNSNTLLLSSTEASSDSSPFRLEEGVVSNGHASYSTNHFLFGSPSMDNQTGANDNARFFFNKEKAAFRAGSASGASWDRKNIGDFSLAANYRTEAKGHRSVALGNNTIAESFSETVMGSYNRLAAQTDKDDWVPTTRLFTLGNGKNSSERSDALVVLKNGNVGFNTHLFGQDAAQILSIGAGTAPTTSTSDTVQLFAVQDVANRTELQVMDSEANITVLSPHRFELIPRSEPMAWSFYAKNRKHNRIINVDVLAAFRELEKLAGKPLVFMSDLEGNRLDNAFVPNGFLEVLEQLQERILMLEAEVEALKTQRTHR